MEKLYVHQTYNTIAKQFHNTRYSHWENVKEFLDGLPQYGFLADIGCGNGKYSTYRQDLVYMGSDICLPLLDIGYSKNVILANGLHLPYQNNMFDGVICIAVIHHIFDIENRIQFVKELIRIAKGKILITVWANEQQKKQNWLSLEGNGDYLIPWGKENLRYYHLFTKNEIYEWMKLCDVEKYDVFYEKENWCITIY